MYLFVIDVISEARGLFGATKQTQLGDFDTAAAIIGD